MSILQLVLNKRLIQSGLTLTTYIQNQVNQNNDFQSVFKFLKSVRGVGDKIASFYLREFSRYDE